MAPYRTAGPGGPAVALDLDMDGLRLHRHRRGYTGLLEQLARRVDVDRRPTAGLLAEAAAGAPALDHRGAAVKVHRSLPALQRERVERADVYTQLAAAANAIIF